MQNRFFVFEDDQLQVMDDFKIPSEWWSRPFEYALAEKFLKTDEVVCDAGCGIEHPFKFYAAGRVAELVAVDINEKIKEFESVDKLKFECINMREIGKKFANYFDKIFCISVLEHDIPNLKENLTSFEKALKPKGKIILTVDHPLAVPEQIINILPDINLKIDGEYNYDLPDRILRGYYSNLACFSMVLEKVNNTETKEIKPSETKPLKPKETK